MRQEDALKIVKRPYVTEKTFDPIERENKLTFLVDERATKRAIAQAIETLYEVKVEAVRTVRTAIGKKAYVKLAEESSAADLGSKLGLV